MEKTIAQDFYEAAYTEGEYIRPLDSKIEAAGGIMIASSNWDDEGRETAQSFSPTETWEFPDGSILQVGYSFCC